MSDTGAFSSVRLWFTVHFPRLDVWFRRVRMRFCRHRRLELRRLGEHWVGPAPLILASVTCARCGYHWTLHASPEKVRRRDSLAPSKAGA